MQAKGLYNSINLKDCDKLFSWAIKVYDQIPETSGMHKETNCFRGMRVFNSFIWTMGFISQGKKRRLSHYSFIDQGHLRAGM